MNGTDIRILRAHEIAALLTGRETDVLHAVRAAYEAHAFGVSSLPHSTFLRFPDSPQNRIIALPAYLGDDFDVAGVKWIASFPDNHSTGLERASAVVILNSLRTGRPEAILEGSIISAQRTAASAALGAQYLHQDRGVSCVGIIGCGLINLEIVRFLRVAFPAIDTLVTFDTSEEHVARFKELCRTRFAGLEVVGVPDAESVLRTVSLCSLATTTAEPHIHDLTACPPGSTILNISLRDLSPQAILTCDNVVDDVDHVCRAQTSVHLAEQLVGNRAFIRCTLADITSGAAVARAEPDTVAVFSPFGLGVLDLAVSKLVLDLALATDQGTVITSFLPGPMPRPVTYRHVIPAGPHAETHELSTGETSALPDNVLALASTRTQ